MKNLGCFKDFRVAPLNGKFDARSASGTLNFFDFRVVLNMDLSDQNKRCRMGGWQKLQSDSPFGFNNQDLHDQLLDCQTYYNKITRSQLYGPVLTGYQYPFWFQDEYGGYGVGDPVPMYSQPYTVEEDYCGTEPYTRAQQCRETITLLYEAVSVSGRRKLLAGTKSRLYVLNERSGNWRLLLDGAGGEFQVEDNCNCSQRRFKVAQVGNVLIITNNSDPVMTWEMQSGPNGCDLWSTEFISDLQGLGITRAGVVAAWQGFAFIADVEVNNERHASRIYWSDLNNPRTWAPGGGSLAGFFDLGLGERVTNIAPVGGQLRCYTTRGDEKAIYDITIVGGDAILNFKEIYRGPDGIEYENSLVSTGGSHFYFSSSGIMVLGEYERTPQRLEWTYKADGVFYNGLPGEWVRDFAGLSGFGSVNKDACDNVIGFYNSERKQVWFSWPTDANECANMSLCLNPVFQVASLVDHGFSAGCVWRPDYTPALRDFLAQYAGCDPSTLIMQKEGKPIATSQGPTPAFVCNPTEDPSLPCYDDSVCGYLYGLTLEDLCEGCGTSSVLVMASTQDKCLKQFEPAQYFRERYIDPATIYECQNDVVPAYSLDPYVSMLQSDAGDFKIKTEKLIKKFVVFPNPAVQTTPSLLHGECAFGNQPECLVWDRSAKPQKLDCLTKMSRNKRGLRKIRADEIPSFKFYRRGVYLAWRFWVGGTGGGSEFNDVTLSVRQVQGDWR